MNDGQDLDRVLEQLDEDPEARELLIQLGSPSEDDDGGIAILEVLDRLRALRLIHNSGPSRLDLTDLGEQVYERLSDQ